MRIVHLPIAASRIPRWKLPKASDKFPCRKGKSYRRKIVISYSLDAPLHRHKFLRLAAISPTPRRHSTRSIPPPSVIRWPSCWIVHCDFFNLLQGGSASSKKSPESSWTFYLTFLGVKLSSPGQVQGGWETLLTVLRVLGATSNDSVASIYSTTLPLLGVSSQVQPSFDLHRSWLPQSPSVHGTLNSRLAFRARASSPFDVEHFQFEFSNWPCAEWTVNLRI